ncbi:HlyD family efflux transporter periplasmic adaptor subunit [Parabacteroides sp. PF5-9]|uniref:HlyD family secretion protein n=1 Tax=Parabacteroides sp. PF5-9 TaxID=1742404 RepID=UPI002474F8DE|nr:HlyD family efflux transporter periplasmic adaptor subunit [Parabacteroides sp. PF5-9]MDH6359014.1 multidrug resistance efflux pump [Parabacteroides sp. PF5-9]
MKKSEIEIRSEEVQEVMGQIPAWIVRWGITILFVVILILVIGSCFFRYPDVIVTEMTLTGSQPVAQVVARSSGKINGLWVGDGQSVEQGMILAVIENAANTQEVLNLKKFLEKTDRIDTVIPLVDIGGSLGDIQSAYASFLNSVYEYRNYKALDYYPKKITSTNDQIEKYKVYASNLKQQQQVMELQHEIAGRQYARDSLLFVRQVLSPSEHETSRTTWLQSRYSLEGTNASLQNLNIQIGQLEETLLDLRLQQQEKESVLTQNLRVAIEQLQSGINGWELNYCLTAPIAGKVTFTTYWNENQYIRAGENAFTVVPDEDEAVVGKALLPVQRSGKVRTGQRVITRFLNYPDQEFGIVNGVVASISLVPSENNYMVEVAFPEGLTTNYGKTLPLSHEMKASAEIVTEELRLIERFFMPLKRIWKEGMSKE